jgi:hypothetical protein
MNLGELLSELRVNILNDRSDRVAGTSDYLWTDETLVRYINEAQRRFARLGLVIRDNTTPEVVEIPLQTGISEYTLHQSVLAVISARHDGDAADLARAGHSQFDTYRQPDPYFFDGSQLTTIPDGKPLAFSTDETVGADDRGSISAVVMRIYPTPSAAYDGDVVRLRVCRLPMYPFRATSLKALPEIPEDHHLEMLDWAAYLALRIVDQDAGWKGRADEFRMSFEGHVAAARRSVMRKLFAPLQWGFGRNGFSWEK